MIAVDANILARYYVDDPADAEAAGQRRCAERAMRETDHVFVPQTVVLELTWVLRSFYDFSADALHLASADACEAFLTFDDRRFAKRAQKLGCTPQVKTPA